ncbi:dapper homolog 1 [Acanthochromis polyacanthus]|uniref:Dishevelled-binding antagonist of beta-catenin 1 n=1 Tax=Acanthochromis polyacanthus TaxID=80966 RepID=A0A3Q1GM73_9TELE|nr:dapper homolog 1 [Acanthochromis polyacanthus]
MLLSGSSRRDPGGRGRAAAAADSDAAERQRSVRERLEATVSGLGELDFLRQRQELLVRAALEEEDERRRRELSSEEKLLEENILLLRKQLNCLRRRDAGLISQLQELDRQISDLRLDTEASHDQLETDSRPSSGFYELSDGASGSLSNSSNSVFSECFCSTADTDGRLPSTDELAGCLECDGLLGGLCDDLSSSATVRRSLSAPQPTVDADAQSKYHCDLVARNGSDVYRYPSPLHAVAVQSPAFLQVLGHGRDEAGGEGLKTETCPPPVSAPPVPQSSSWPASFSQTPPLRRLDSYIFSLLQRRAQPIRTSRPRTSISTDPSKSILRQASLCIRQVSNPGSSSGSGLGSEVKPCWPTGGASGDFAASSPQRSVEVKGDEQEPPSVDVMPNGFQISSNDTASPRTNKDMNTSSLLRTKSKGLLPQAAASTATLPKDFRGLSTPRANSSPKQPCCPPAQELLPLINKTQAGTPKNNPRPEAGEQQVAELASLGSSSQSPDEAAGSHLVNSRYVPAQQHAIKVRKGGSKNVKTVKVKTSRTSERSDLPSERRADKSQRSKKPRLLDDGGSTHIKVSKRGASSRMKCLPASIPEGRVLDRHTGSVRSGSSKHHHHGNHHHYSSNHHHHHHHHHHHNGRDQVVVVAKPKHKRNDYRRLRAIMEMPYDEAFRRAQRRQRKELLSISAANGYPSSPYAYAAGSDSEYSAECASLFHSTIVETSEDERSNYTMNCFGDSESSEEEDVEESTATSDTEESGGGGMGRGRGQLGAAGVRAAGQEATQAKAFVKIKASHNLKKKILRFRSGSLKLMTTV